MFVSTCFYTGEEDDVLSGSDDFANDEEEDVLNLPGRQHLSDAAKLVSNLKNLSTNGLPPELPQQLELVNHVKHDGTKYTTILTKVDLKQGTRFGPYSARISKDKIPSCYILKVSKKPSFIQYHFIYTCYK